MLPAPTGLTQTAPNTPAFDWQSVPGAVACDVYCDHEFLKQVTGLSYQDTDRLADGTYEYTLKAVNALGVEGTESDALPIQLLS